MLTILLSVVLSSVTPALVALPVLQDGRDPYRLVVVDASGQEAGFLSGLDLDVVGPTPDGAGIEVIAQARELAILAESGLPHTILRADLERHYAERLVPSEEPLGAVGGSITPGFGQGGMGGYHTFDEVVAILDQLTAAHPQIMTARFSLGTSIEGRDLWAVKVSDNPGSDENEPEVRFDALHHAREPMSMESTLYYLAWLLEGYGNDPLATYLVDERETWFVPVVNPDGYVHNQTTNPGGGGMWRKNRRMNAGGSIGVDLNRNYPFRWGFDNVGSSPSPTSSTYRGAGPASEPEIAAMVAFFQSRSFRTALSSHSYSNYWLAPWAFTNSLPADHADFQEIGALATVVSGYPFEPWFDQLYPSNGVTIDQDYGPHDTYSWTPEIGSSAQGFWPPINALIPLATSVFDGFQTTALAAGPYARHEGTALLDLGDGDGDHEPGEVVGVIVGARNSGRGAAVASATLISNSPSLVVTTGASPLGGVAPFTSADNSSAPLLMTIDPDATPGAMLSFTAGVTWGGPDETAAFTLTVGAPEPEEWTNLGGGSPGSGGVPALTANGTLVVATPFQIDLANAPPSALMLAWLAFDPTPIAALGGTLHASPADVQFFRVSDGAGALSEGGPWPPGVPPGTELTLQFLVQDLSVPAQITLSNAVRKLSP